MRVSSSSVAACSCALVARSSFSRACTCALLMVADVSVEVDAEGDEASRKATIATDVLATVLAADRLDDQGEGTGFAIDADGEVVVDDRMPVGERLVNGGPDS